MKQLNKDLYSFKQLEDNSWEVKLTDENHPVFQAHFESNPLLPAFLQIDIMGEILDKSLSEIMMAKFKLAILPSDTVIYKVTKIVNETYSVKIFKNDKIVSEMKLTYD